MHHSVARAVERAFLKAYQQHADELFRFCYYRVYDREKAKDLLQEAFTRVWRYLADGGEIKNYRAFLYQTARHLVIDASRRPRTSSLEQLQTERGFQPAIDDRPRLLAGIELDRVSQAVAMLDTPYREAVTLRYGSGLKPKEIAAVTGETAGVISVRIHRGVKRLREILKSSSPSSL